MQITAYTTCMYCIITGIELICKNKNLELDKNMALSYNISVARFNTICPSGGMADAVDSKSTDSNIVGVQVPSRALGCTNRAY